MNGLSFRRVTLGALIALASVGVAGCGSKLNGTYENPNGIMSVEFKSGKAYVTMMFGTVESDYEVKGDKIILHTGNQNLVLTRNGDGTLSGPMGKMTKTTKKDS